MGNYEQLKAAVSDVIKTNGTQAITGQVLQNTLLTIINSMGSNYQFVGIAATNTNPGTPDQNVFYIAGEGTYTNFSNLTIDVGQLGVLKWNGVWSKQVLEIGSGGGNLILNWNTDVETTRKQVLSKYRKPGVQISYENPETGWINEQYIGTSVTDTEWIKDENWEQIPNAETITTLKEELTFLKEIEIYKEQGLSHSGSTNVYMPIMSGKLYKFISSDSLNITIKDDSFQLQPNKAYIYKATNDYNYFNYAKYGLLNYLIVSEIDEVKNTLDATNIKTEQLDKIINGQNPIFNRARIEIGTVINGSRLNLPIPGSGESGAFLSVQEGDVFYITSNQYSEVYRTYGFFNEKFEIIEDSYATGILDNQKITAPNNSKYLALNKTGTNFKIVAENNGIKTDIDNIKTNLTELNNDVAEYNNLLYNDVFYYNDTIQAAGSTRFNVNLLKGQSYILLASEGMANFTLGERGVGENLGTIQANTETIITPKENVSLIYFERYGSIDIKIYQTFNIQQQIEEIKSYISLKSKYQSFSLLGDSYSTYEGYLTPEENETYYPADNVDSVEKTWWGLLAKEQGMILMQNNSYSGSYVCNSEKANSNLQQNSFIRRMNDLMKASVIFLFGGTNDSWNNVDLGEFKYSDWTEEELKTFRPAFAYMLDFIKRKHFGSKIVVIKNPPVANGTGFTEEISASIDEICLHYSIDTLSPSISKASNWHPNEAGMRSIYETIVDYLQNN